MKKLLIHATDTLWELLLIYGSIVFVSALAFAHFEHKSLWDSIWWASVTGMTVGYGDLYPVTVGGRITAILLMHIVPMFVMPMFIARFLMSVLDDRNQFTHEEQEEMKTLLKEIKSEM